MSRTGRIARLPGEVFSLFISRLNFRLNPRFIVKDRRVAVSRSKTRILQNEPKLFETDIFSKSFHRNIIHCKVARSSSKMTVQNEPKLRSTGS